MRIIKFRAWDKERNKMWTSEEMGSDELSLNPDGRGFCNPNPGDVRLTTYFDFMIPLQFTELHDKNGKEIYEGDIVRTEGGRLCEVLWFSSPAFCGWDQRALNSEGQPNPNWDLWSVTVVGNIYENPELIEGNIR